MKVIGKTVSLAVMVMCILFLISGITVSATEESKECKISGNFYMDEIVREKIVRNNEKYPIEKAKDSAKKYNEL